MESRGEWPHSAVFDAGVAELLLKQYASEERFNAVAKALATPPATTTMRCGAAPVGRETQHTHTHTSYHHTHTSCPPYTRTHT